MGLEDKTNALITKADEKILGLHARVATHWQKKTYQPKETLVTAIHTTASAAYAGALIGLVKIYPHLVADASHSADAESAFQYLSAVALAGTLYEGVKAAGCWRAKPRHVEFAEDQRKGWDPYRRRLRDVLRFAVTPLHMPLGLLFTGVGIAYRNEVVLAAGIAFTGLPAGFWLGGVGNYLNRIDVGAPPKKEEIAVLVPAPATE